MSSNYLVFGYISLAVLTICWINDQDSGALWGHDVYVISPQRVTSVRHTIFNGNNLTMLHALCSRMDFVAFVIHKNDKLVVILQKTSKLKTNASQEASTYDLNNYEFLYRCQFQTNIFSKAFTFIQNGSPYLHIILCNSIADKLCLSWLPCIAFHCLFINVSLHIIHCCWVSSQLFVEPCKCCKYWFSHIHVIIYHCSMPNLWLRPAVLLGSVIRSSRW